MKYAFMSFSCPDLEFREMLALAVRAGYDGVEPRLEAGHGHGVELGTSGGERSELRRLAEQVGISICCLATGVHLANPESQFDQLEVARHSMDLAKDIGCPMIRVFGGSFPDEIDRNDATKHLASALHQLIPHAEKNGIQIVLETHDHWCQPDHVAEVLRQVNHPLVGVNWDFQHPLRTCGWTIQKSFETLHPWILHVHFHDGTMEQSHLEMLPVGEGAYEVEKVVALLLEMHYEGFLSGEWFDWPDYEDYLPREVRQMREFEAHYLQGN